MTGWALLGRVYRGLLRLGFEFEGRLLTVQDWLCVALAALNTASGFWSCSGCVQGHGRCFSRQGRVLTYRRSMPVGDEHPLPMRRVAALLSMRPQVLWRDQLDHVHFNASYLTIIL